MIGKGNLPFLSKNRDYTVTVEEWTAITSATSSGNSITINNNGKATSAKTFEVGSTGRIQLSFTVTTATRPGGDGYGLKIGLCPASGNINNMRGFAYKKS